MSKKEEKDGMPKRIDGQLVVSFRNAWLLTEALELVEKPRNFSRQKSALEKILQATDTQVGAQKNIT